MGTPFTYSVLQYRHSLLLCEAINAAVLFHFPAADRVEFVAGDARRVRAIYPDFDQAVYDHIIKSIETKCKDGARPADGNTNLRSFIGGVLPEDATVLQFQEPTSVTGRESDRLDVDKTVAEFSRLLLPEFKPLK
jgi:hypothetical protein